MIISTSTPGNVIITWGPCLFLCDYLLPHLLLPNKRVDLTQLLGKFQELCNILEYEYTEDPDKLIKLVKRAHGRCIYELKGADTLQRMSAHGE